MLAFTDHNDDEFQYGNDDELQYIIQCHKPSQLPIRINLNRCDQIKKKVKRFSFFPPSRQFTSTMLATLTEGPSQYRMLLFGISLSLVTAGLIPLTILTGGITLAVVAGSMFYFYAHYKEIAKKHRKKELNRQFLAFKTECLDELIRRKLKNLDENKVQALCNNFQKHPDNHLLDLNKINKPKHSYDLLKGSIGSAFLLGTTLFQNYYLSTYTILNALKCVVVATAMVSVVGLSIAVGAMLAIGIFFSYTQYQVGKNLKKQEHTDKLLEHNFQAKRRYLEELGTLEKTSMPVQKTARAKPSRLKQLRHLGQENAAQNLNHQQNDATAMLAWAASKQQDRKNIYHANSSTFNFAKVNEAALTPGISDSNISLNNMVNLSQNDSSDDSLEEVAVMKK